MRSLTVALLSFSGVSDIAFLMPMAEREYERARCSTSSTADHLPSGCQCICSSVMPRVALSIASCACCRRGESEELLDDIGWVQFKPDCFPAVQKILPRTCADECREYTVPLFSIAARRATI